MEPSQETRLLEKQKSKIIALAQKQAQHERSIRHLTEQLQSQSNRIHVSGQVIETLKNSRNDLQNQLSEARTRSDSLLSDKLVMGCMLKYFEGRVQKLENEQQVILPITVNNEVKLPITIIQSPPSNPITTPSSSNVSSNVMFSLTPAQLKYLIVGGLFGMETGGIVFETPCSRPSVVVKKVVKKTFAKVFGKKKTKKTAYRTCIGVAEPFPLPAQGVV